MRLQSLVSARTRIEVVTEGVFARMILDDPSLESVAAVLFDEFHERSLDVLRRTGDPPFQCRMMNAE